jgi:hypothetical protein
MMYPALLALMHTPQLPAVGKEEIWFLLVCHHFSNTVYLKLGRDPLPSTSLPFHSSLVI